MRQDSIISFNLIRYLSKQSPIEVTNSEYFIYRYNSYPDNRASIIILVERDKTPDIPKYKQNDLEIIPISYNLELHN